MSPGPGRAASAILSCQHMTPPALTFLGAAGTVTGSKHLLEADGRRILVDCGLFQGLKELRLRNWAPLPVDPGTIDALILTHAHLDHCGYLPRLVAAGFRGRVFCTPATKDLCSLVLPDSEQFFTPTAQMSPNERRLAIGHIVKLYEAWGKPDQAAAWQNKLDDFFAKSQTAVKAK